MIANPVLFAATKAFVRQAEVLTRLHKASGTSALIGVRKSERLNQAGFKRFHIGRFLIGPVVVTEQMENAMNR